MSLYRDDILAHARNPQYRGTIAQPDMVASLTNTTCGDEITLSLRVQGTGDLSTEFIPNGVEGLRASPVQQQVVYGASRRQTIKEVAFEGKGCIISQAAADMFAEHILGQSLAEAARMAPEEMLALFPAPITEGRKPCALLAYEALRRELAPHNSALSAGLVKRVK